MGTSGRSDGPNPGTPLVPSWLDEVPAGPPPALPSEPPPGGELPISQLPAPPPGPLPPGPPRPLPPLPPPPPPDRFRAARSNFSRFAGSGGSDRRSLRRAARDYVRSGTGGSRNATRRMGASRPPHAACSDVLRDFQRDGVTATLRRLNLGDLVGRPLEDVFIGLTDVICGDGGSIDEGIALDAWLETIAELEEFDVADSGRAHARSDARHLPRLHRAFGRGSAAPGYRRRTDSSSPPTSQRSTAFERAASRATSGAPSAILSQATSRHQRR